MTPSSIPSPTVQFLSQTWQDSCERWSSYAGKALKPEKGKTLVLGGHGLRLNVERGSLRIKDGYCMATGTPEAHDLHRGVHGVDRIILVGCTGSVTFDALVWCKDQGIHLSLIDDEGSLVMTTIDESSDILLRRSQYRAMMTGQDLEVCKWLVIEKIKGQRDNLGDEAIKDIMTMLMELVNEQESISGVRNVEGRAAAVYFACHEDTKLNWRKADSRLVPPHWLKVGKRGSLVGKGNRKASDPCNAMLNYAYAILESQCRLALAQEGFDATCGFLHADLVNRDSLVYDLMELYRPLVDKEVFKLALKTRFTYGDLVEDKEGQCKLNPSLAKAVVSRCRINQVTINSGAQALKGQVQE